MGERVQALLRAKNGDAVDIRQGGPPEESSTQAQSLPARDGLQDGSTAKANMSILRCEARRRLRVSGALPQRLQDNALKASRIQGPRVGEDLPRCDGQFAWSLSGEKQTFYI